MGTVLSERGGEPVDRASVSLAGARTGVHTDERGRTLAATKSVPDGIYVSDHDRGRARHGKPEPVDARVDPDER